jgi:TRAP-type mannitol/chloroaromatic compound transport system permease large subunit
MNRVRTSSRLTSVVVILAVMAITVLGVCGVAFGAPATGGAMGGTGACTADSHGSAGLASAAAESPRITIALSGVVPADILLGVSQGQSSRSAAVSAELPPPSDPRHGRIRV